MKGAMESSKWLATVASIWIQCSSGASYTFGIYSSSLKLSQGYDQSTLDTVSVFKDIGANAGIISGLLYAYQSRGPWVVHVAGAIQCFVGYFFMWLSVAGHIPNPHVSLMCLFMFLAAHSQTFFNTANVVTAVHNFPQYNGTIVGIMKGFLGLSGAILVQIHYALFIDKPSNFLLMLALLPTLVSVFLMCLVKIDHTYTKNDKRHLNNFSSVSIFIAAYLMLLIILEDLIDLPQLVRVFALIILLLLLSSLIGFGIKARKEDSLISSSLPANTNAPLLNDPETSSSASSENPKDMNLIETVCSMNFWLLFIAMMCGMGSGLATINNISQIGESLGYTLVETSALISLWSIWNFLGRFMAGYMSDIFMHKNGWPRPLFICITLATMSIGHLIIASGFPGNLYVGSVLVGVSYGSQWSLMPTITSEIFGVKHMGTIFNTIAIASPVGSYIFSVQAIGKIYDKEASGNECYGTHCFMLSFFILAFLSFCGSLVALVLFFNTRKFYTQVLLRRLRRAATQ